MIISQLNFDDLRKGFENGNAVVVRMHIDKGPAEKDLQVFRIKGGRETFFNVRQFHFIEGGEITLTGYFCDEQGRVEAKHLTFFKGEYFPRNRTGVLKMVER